LPVEDDAARRLRDRRRRDNHTGEEIDVDTISQGERTARRVAARVGALLERETPPGMASWPPLLTIVGQDVDELLDRISELQERDTAETRGAVNVAVDRVLAQWRQARAEWMRRKTQGREVPA